MFLQIRVEPIHIFCWTNLIICENGNNLVNQDRISAMSALSIYYRTAEKLFITFMHGYESKWISGKYERVDNSGVLRIFHKFIILAT